jgi:phosphomannomutase
MIHLFDVDGTLTEARQKINADFEHFFKGFCNSNLVYLVTGSDIEKIYEQLGTEIVDKKVLGVFANMGNVFHSQGKVIYRNHFVVQECVIQELEKVVNDYNLLKTGNHIEYRAGMINFSLIGRNATQEQRTEYANDPEAQRIRSNVCEYLKNLFDGQNLGIEICLGGQISMDIQPKGRDKRQAVSWLRERLPTNKITFYGDRTEKGGNDHTVANEVLNCGGIVHQVSGWQHTEQLLKKLNTKWVK